MTETVIVEAVRTPVGRRGGGLSTMHPADLLAVVLREVIDRSGLVSTVLQGPFSVQELEAAVQKVAS